MLWFLVGIAVVIGLAAAITFQQRHEIDLIAILTPLCGAPVDLAITPTSSKFATIGEFTGVMDRVDPATRWVSFAWIELREGGQVGMLSPDALANGVIADCIRWVEPHGQSRIDLT